VNNFARGWTHIRDYDILETVVGRRGALNAVFSALRENKSPVTSRILNNAQNGRPKAGFHKPASMKTESRPHTARLKRDFRRRAAALLSVVSGVGDKTRDFRI
jgi:hypothetical protein